MVLGAVLIWALSFPLIKVALRNVEPLTLGALRHLIFIPLFLVLYLKAGKKAFSQSKNSWLLFVGVGTFAIALPNIFQNIGMLYTTVSASSIIQSSGPIFTLILAVTLLKESLTYKKILGTMLALLGAVLLVTNCGFQLTGRFIGNFLLLLSAISYAISAIITKKGLESHEPFTLLSFGVFTGCIMLLACSLPLENISSLQIIPSEVWLVIILLALFPTFIAAWLWYKVLVSTEVSKLTPFIYLMPVFAVIFSYILVGELVSLQTVFFACLIIYGVALVQH